MPRRRLPQPWHSSPRTRPDVSRLRQSTRDCGSSDFNRWGASNTNRPGGEVDTQPTRQVMTGLAIFSDVHANLQAMEVVRDSIECRSFDPADPEHAGPQLGERGRGCLSGAGRRAEKSRGGRWDFPGIPVWLIGPHHGVLEARRAVADAFHRFCERIVSRHALCPAVDGTSPPDERKPAEGRPCGRPIGAVSSVGTLDGQAFHPLARQGLAPRAALRSRRGVRTTASCSESDRVAGGSVRLQPIQAASLA